MKGDAMPSKITDAAGLSGAACIVAGCGWIYAPAGLIVAGVLLMTAAILGARRAAKGGQ